MSGRRFTMGVALGAAVALAVSACGTSSKESDDPPGGSGGGKVITAAASINAWGSILSQLGGTHVKTTSIITSPDTDPHDYEPTVGDARTSIPWR